MQWLLLALGVTAVDAFPRVFEALNAQHEARDVAKAGCSVSKLCNTKVEVSDAEAHIPSSPNAFTKASKARSNCGEIGVCDTFDAAEQYVSTSGNNAFRSPGYYDRRGPCPGLNAAANHGYLPRNGLATITQTISGLGAAYNMAPDLAGFLAAYAIALDGDVLSMQWSIGGPMEEDLLADVLGNGQGISWSHNNYEGDTSIGRCDAYTNNGDAHSLSITRFNYAYASGISDDSYTLDKFSMEFAKNTHRSIQQNPYYFTGLFSTTLVSPAAYNFVINFMSNHSAEHPGGYLNGKMFKEFFAVTGEYPNFKWQKGQERIPENWYRRPTSNQYSIASVFGDLGVEFLAYPDTFRFGGNVNGVNTYTGIDIANFTNGVFNADTLFQGNNLGCFILQNEQMFLPTELNSLTNDVAGALSLIDKYTPDLGCPALGKYDPTVLQKYPGSGYKPAAPFTGPYNC